ncbi:MAG: ATP-binding cassette domain-containing protein [bacterium]
MMMQKNNQEFLTFKSVSFTYDTLEKDLFKDINFTLTSGWTGIIGNNGAGKTTLLKLATAVIKPKSGYIKGPSKVFYCQQQIEFPPNDFEAFLYSPNNDSRKLCSMLSIKDDWIYRWDTLSCGERKRFQVAIALWSLPDLLAMDEPTNHMDYESSEIVLNALKSFTGIGLLVSHNRHLLDALCSQCLFIESDEIIIRPGGITQGLIQQKNDFNSALSSYNIVKKEYKKIEKEIKNRKRLAESQQKRRSKRRLAPKDHDARFKKNLARVSGKDGIGGKLLRQLDGRFKHVKMKLELKRIKKKQKTGISSFGDNSKRDIIYYCAPRILIISDSKQLKLPELVIKPSDRIGITGINGIGKSSLIRLIISEIKDADFSFLYIPQEIEIKNATRILATFHESPNEVRGRVLSIINRLGSDPKKLLNANVLSPGEIRKLILAMGMEEDPILIIMDEPTNHMDMTSILCLEEALKETPSSLLLVSHDMVFLKSLVSTRWHIIKSNDCEGLNVLNIIYL